MTAKVHHRKSLVQYEWVAAKYKPDARILSRKEPPMVGSGSGAMTDVSGLTRYGVYRAPHAILIGRPPEKEANSIGETFYFQPPVTGKGKPRALLVGRPKVQLIGSGGEFENLYGKTRYGRFNPPRPVIISRHTPKEKIEPGPGAYGLANPPDKRIGISLKGWPDAGECVEPSPEFVMLPSTGKGPALSLKGRHYSNSINQSPGPIYDTREQIDTRKGVSMTFKPFPPHEGDVLPGPSHYGRLPGDEALNQALIRFPAVKFASKDYDPDSSYTKDTSSSPGPGPGAFDISNVGKSRGPKALIVSRQKFKSQSCRSNRLENLFGKTRFGLVGKPGAILAGRYHCKKKCESEGDGLAETGPGAGYRVLPDKRIGITIKSRIPEIGANRNAQLPGPGSYNLPGFIGEGPAYSIIRKYFYDLDGTETVRRDCKKEKDREKKPADPCNRAQLDMIDKCIRQVEANRAAGMESDPCSFIPLLETLATT